MTPLLDKTELATLLKVPVSWVEDATAARRIPFTRVGKHIRFSEAHVAAIIKAGETLPASQSPLRARRRAA